MHVSARDGRKEPSSHAATELRSPPSGPALLGVPFRPMTVEGAPGGRSRNLVLAAMIFAVAMTFIDQTIVSIAVPQIQRELGLTSTGVQWMVNAYLLSLAALFAFGGRLADTVGHRRMAVLGVIIFAAASAMCGLTPKGSLAEAWIVTFRAVQGVGGAIMFPACAGDRGTDLRSHERQGSGDLLRNSRWTDGDRPGSRWLPDGVDMAGDLLGEHTRGDNRAHTHCYFQAYDRPSAGQDGLPGTGAGSLGVGLSVFGFQQSRSGDGVTRASASRSGPGCDPRVFAVVEGRTASPLIQVRIFRIRAFMVENLVLGIAMLVFIPVFFFGSEYAQIALGKSSKEAGVISCSSLSALWSLPRSVAGCSTVGAQRCL